MATPTRAVTPATIKKPPSRQRRAAPRPPRPMAKRAPGSRGAAGSAKVTKATAQRARRGNARVDTAKRLKATARSAMAKGTALRRSTRISSVSDVRPCGLTPREEKACTPPRGVRAFFPLARQLRPTWLYHPTSACRSNGTILPAKREQTSRENRTNSLLPIQKTHSIWMILRSYFPC